MLELESVALSLKLRKHAINSAAFTPSVFFAWEEGENEATYNQHIENEVERAHGTISGQRADLDKAEFVAEMKAAARKEQQAA
jgi:hypothetical protein